MNIDPADIEIKIKLLKSESTLAQVTLILFGQWVEKGWRVSRSKVEHPTFHDYVWIQPPCFPGGGGKWQEIVYIDDRRLYEEVHAKIFDSYCREKNKEDAVSGSQDINYEEIDKQPL